MVIALICSGIIAGALAGIALWIAGYGIGLIALAYWTAGSIAIIVMVMIKFMLSHFFHVQCSRLPH